MRSRTKERIRKNGDGDFFKQEKSRNGDEEKKRVKKK